MKNLKEKLKEMKGITLIALVVTIVILIILAGVAISFAMGRNGIIERSREGTAESTKQTAYEQLKLKILDCQVESYGERNEKPTLAYLAAYLKREEGGEIYSVTSESQPLAQIDETPYLNWSAIYTRLSAYPDYEFKINNTLQIAEVNGIKVADVGINTDDADATAEDILKDKTAYVKGSKITGTMVNRGQLNWNPSTNTSTNIEPGYYTGGTLSTANAFAAGAASSNYVTGTFNPKVGTTNSPDLGFYPSKVLIYYLGSSWSAMVVITRSGARDVASWGDTNLNVSDYWKMTSNGFKSICDDSGLQGNWTYYAFP